MSRTSVGTFLRQSKAFIVDAVRESRRLSDTTICTGNEAGDLDSVACAIAYAYLASGGVADGKFVPLVRTLRRDLRLRNENIIALERANVDAADLTCADDFGNHSLAELTYLGAKYALVDHNKADPVFTSNGQEPSVTSVLDHHVDEGLYKNAAPRHIEASGSCTSLVALTFEQSDSWTPEVADILLSGILIDTRLVGEPKGKATPTDFAAAKLLSAHSTIPSTTQGLMGSVESVDAWTARLIAAKDNVDSLTVSELLRRDLKLYDTGTVKYSISSVPRSLAELEVLARSEGTSLRDALEAFGRELSAGFVFVLSSFKTNGRRQRELGLFVSKQHEQYVMDALAKISQEQKDMLGYVPVVQDSRGLSSWGIRNSVSRKVLAPILGDVLRDR